MAQRDHARVVLAYAFYGACAQTHHHARETILAAQLGAPEEHVLAVGHTGRGRKVEIAVSLPLDHLNQDRHPLIVVQEAALLAVKQDIRVVDAGVNARDGLRQRSEVLIRGTLIRAEYALIHAGERKLEIVLQQAGRTYDQRLTVHGCQQLPQFLLYCLGEPALAVGSLNQRVVVPDFVDGFVLLIQEADEIVGLQEVVAHICADEVGLGDGQADGIAPVGEPGNGLVEDAPGKHEAGRLAADLAPTDAVVANPMQVIQR